MTPMTHDDIAERTRQAIGRMIEALVAEFEGQDRATALSGMVAGNSAQAAQFALRIALATGIPIALAKAEFDKSMADYWQQAVAGHLGAAGATVQ